MTRSSRPPSTIAPGRLAMSEGPDESGPGATAVDLPRAVRLGSRLASSVRWLHTYLSMFGLAALLFFSLYRDHPEPPPGPSSTGSPRTSEAEGRCGNRLGRRHPARPATRGPGSGSLEVVEAPPPGARPPGRPGPPRSRPTTRSALVTIQGPRLLGRCFHPPGRRPVPPDRERRGLFAVMNDLHKGARPPGPILVGGGRPLVPP